MALCREDEDVFVLCDEFDAGDVQYDWDSCPYEVLLPSLVTGSIPANATSAAEGSWVVKRCVKKETRR
jgi:hypothetical protein